MFSLKRNRDAQAVAKVLAGQHEHFGHLVDQYLPVVQAIACARLGNAAEAEDVAQESFVRAWQCLDQLREPHKFGPWIGTITRNIATRFQLDRSRAADVARKADFAGVMATPDTAHVELLDAVRRQVEMLEPDAREVIMLHYFAGKSTREIAGYLELSGPAVRKRLQRAREALGGRLLREYEASELRDGASHRQKVTRILGTVLATVPAWTPSDAAAATAPGVAGTGLAMANGAFWIKAAAAGAALSVASLLYLALHEGTAPESLTAQEPGISEQLAQPGPPNTTQDAVPVSTASRTNVPGIGQPTGIAVSGIIQHSDGTPIPGAKVLGAYWGRKPRVDQEEALTDEEGRYVLYLDQRWKNFLIWAEKPGYSRFKQESFNVPKDGLAEANYTLYRESTLEGRVVTPQGGAVPGVPVTARNYDAENLMWTESTETDSNGAFQIAGLIPGRHGIAVVTEQDYDSTLELATHDLKEGEHAGQLRLVYDGDGLVIAGRVITEEGEPVKGAFVQATNGANPRDTYTDASGAFLIPRMEPGSYPVYAGEEHYESESAMIEAGTSGVEFVLRQRGRVSGRVIDEETGTPIEAFQIQVLQGVHTTIDSYTSIGSTEVTAPLGQFNVEKVPLDVATIVAQAPDYAPAFQVLSLEAAEHLKDLTLALNHGLTLEGQAVDASGAPVDGAAILLGPPPFMPGGTNLDFFASETANAARTLSDATGRFTVRGLLPGEQQFSAWHKDAGAGTITALLESTAAPTPLEIVLVRGGVIRGSVRLAGDVQSGATVLATAPGGTGMPLGMTSTSIDGAYSLEGLSPGPISISGLLSIPGESMGGRRLVVDAQVLSGKETEVNLDYTGDLGDIRGTVQVTDGTPAEGMVTCVCLLQNGREERRIPYSGGEFEIKGIPAGQVSLAASLIIQDTTANTPLTRGRARSQEITVHAGGLSEVAILFDGTGVLQGSIEGIESGEQASILVLDSQTALTEFSLALFSALEPLIRGSAQADADGNYRVDGLNAGTYTALAFTTPGSGPAANGDIRFAQSIIELTDAALETINFDLR